MPAATGCCRCRRCYAIAISENSLRHGPIRSALLAVIPNTAAGWMREVLNALRRLRQAARPAREVFSEVYANKSWGPDEFDSGPGSHGEPARVYVECVINFMKTHKIKRVLDLGCGNFEVGKRIAPECKRYVGVDVVPALIERNRTMFAANNIEFNCLDIIRDPLPNADLCLARQVIQHLSNAEISRLLGKLKKCPHVTVAEHYPETEGMPNIDIVRGGNPRIEKHGSAVYLDKPPFSVSKVCL